MSIGIIGAGVPGSDVPRLPAKSRMSATIANKRGPEPLVISFPGVSGYVPSRRSQPRVRDLTPM